MIERLAKLIAEIRHLFEHKPDFSLDALPTRDQVRDDVVFCLEIVRAIRKVRTAVDGYTVTIQGNNGSGVQYRVYLNYEEVCIVSLSGNPSTRLQQIGSTLLGIQGDKELVDFGEIEVEYALR